MSYQVQKSYLAQSGVLSDVDIRSAMENLDIIITPYDEKKLTPLGYNLTPTRFVFSTRRRTIEKIHCKDGLEYVYIRPNDTALILSREALFVSDKIMGTFHSKVGMVSKGFGHVGTTLDPFWEGPLLFAINNPTSSKLKFMIQKKDNDDNSVFHYSYVTVVFQSFINSSIVEHDNPSLRLNILKSHIKGKYFVYKDLQTFCAKIEGLTNIKKPLFKESYQRLYSIQVDSKNDKACFKNEFVSKYKNYILTVNDAIDEIRLINKWVILLNGLKAVFRLWYVTIPYLLGLFFTICGLFQKRMLSFDAYEELTIGMSIIAVATGLFMAKKSNS